MSFKQSTFSGHTYPTLHNQSAVRVCTEPESRFIPSGKQVASFSTVFVETYGKDPQMVRESWVKITGWEKQAEAIMRLHKGDMILIATTIPGMDTWENADGTTGTGLSATMNGFPRRIKFLKNDEQDESVDSQSEHDTAVPQNTIEDNISF